MWSASRSKALGFDMATEGSAAAACNGDDKVEVR